MDAEKNLYSNGFIINYPEGDRSLERVIIPIESDLYDKSYVTKEGDTLLTIAHFFYGTSRPWWLIADNNENVIENVFDLVPGTELIIPNLKKVS